MKNLELISSNRSFGGQHQRYTHFSTSTQTQMTFAIYLPPQVERGKKVPVVYFLSGLTCTDENFSTKAGAQQWAAKYGLALVMPDTSPRGEDVADADSYDLGQGAGFYVNATQEPWAKHYQMYDYVAKELPELIEANFPVTDQRSIFGHSMGGHGALQIGLKNPERYAAISALAPIVNPMEVSWGQKAFTAYLGEDKKAWEVYDSTRLLAQVDSDKCLPILINQGLADGFYPEQLQPERFEAVAKERQLPVTLNLHEGYDHSYYFIASFVQEHLAFHAKHMGLAFTD